MKRSEISAILTRNRGSKAELARRAKVGLTAVSAWIRGGVSKNISEKAEEVALELLAKEAAAKDAEGDVNGPSVRKVIDKLRTKSAPSEEE